MKATDIKEKLAGEFKKHFEQRKKNLIEVFKLAGLEDAIEKMSLLASIELEAEKRNSLLTIKSEGWEIAKLHKEVVNLESFLLKFLVNEED